LRFIKYTLQALILINTILFSQVIDDFNKTTKLWEPYVDFSVIGLSNGNPFDEIALVTFTNTNTSTSIKTEMFYNLNDEWKFRFTGTEIGTWTFITSSSNPTLDNISGSVHVETNDNHNAKGFITNNNGKWATTDDLNNVFAPQLAMYSSPLHFYQNESQIDKDIQTFLIDHGFDGFHIPGSAYWFNLESISSTEILSKHGDNPNPDVRVFEALELLISKVHKIEKTVHIWLWGDETDNWTQVALKGGINGEVDQRLLRYISARLGPLPGWTMEYGFDNWRWVNSSQVNIWHEFMNSHIDSHYSHLLGVRGGGNSEFDENGYWQPSYEEQLNQLSEQMDYSSYEQHKPSYKMYIETQNKRPNKPSFSEDRFRIRNKLLKDYDMIEVRRGLYHSMMAGGVANIWGVLLEESPDPERNRSEFASEEFPNPEWIKTYSKFFENRFLSEFYVDSSFTNGYGLKTFENSHFLVYKEETGIIQFDLRSIPNSLPVVGIDTKLPYKEIHFGKLSQNQYTWHTPYQSDWVIAIGYFDSLSNNFPRDSIVALDSLLVNSNNFQIASLTAINIDGNIEINLITDNENNIGRIELQKTEALLNDWTTIFEFSPDTLGNVTSNYSYTDTTSLPDIDYLFRVKAIFNDGTEITSESTIVIFDDSVYSNEVEIQSFTALQEFSIVNISLVTGSEENIDKIELQKSELNNPNWITIKDFVPEDSQVDKNTYLFSDNIINPEIQYIYRVRIIYKDGSFEVTESINITGSPNNFELLQNYPNPFNNTTIIEFSLPQNTIVRLAIYNSLGELMAVVYDQLMNAGYHKIELNTKNLPSGVYIYTLKAANYFKQRKMILLK